MPYWFQIVRAILELLYFAAGVVIAVAAIWGLKQLKLTKEIFRTNTRRESLRFAAERCQYFAEQTVPAWTRMYAEYKRLNLTFLTKPSDWKIEDGEIVKHNFDPRLLATEMAALDVSIVNFLNSVEAFAIPFVAGVADEDLGFQETAMAFCQVVRLTVPAFFHQRSVGAGRYESTIKLFALWNKRLVANALVPAKKHMDNLAKQMEEITKAVEKDRIKPIGTDF